MDRVPIRQDQPVVLRNATCCYCRNDLAEGEGSKEHVIGKRFVPRGTLDKSWNLITRSCSPCNNRKSDLEDDISVISLQHYPFGLEPERDALATSSLEKSTRAFSRRTRKPVANSQETMGLQLSLSPGADMSVSFTAPAQVDDSRAHSLAMMHAQAFYYLLTYNVATARGTLWPGAAFLPLDFAARPDWGNSIQGWFAQSVAEWPIAFVATAGRDFFKVAIRQHSTKTLWSCALEWNLGMRVVAFFGDEAIAREAASTRPSLYTPTDIAIQFSDRVTRLREAVPLDYQYDRLFSFGELHP